MAVDPRRISERWRQAMMQRACIQNGLEPLVKGKAEASEAALQLLKKAKERMLQFRLACIETAWTDVRRAKDVDDALWSVHHGLLSAFKRAMERCRAQNFAVLHRRLEKEYKHFLQVSQDFYEVYLKKVCTRFDIQELKQALQELGLRQEAEMQDRVDAAASADVKDLVIMSCHKTLLCLGDLSRYRSQNHALSRQNWSHALQYYLQAHCLMPDLGDAHHQCGLVSREMRDELGAVFYWYRSLVSKTPHSSAQANLELAFSSQLKRTSPAPDEALTHWFCTLHAHFDQGQVFRKHSELESTVIVRFNRLLQTPAADHEGADPEAALLKMVQINICAYYVGRAKLREDEAEEARRSCHFILQLNMRIIECIAKCVASELDDVAGQAACASADEPGPEMTPVLMRAVPLLRVCMAWLASDPEALVARQDDLQPYLHLCCAALTHVLSLIVAHAKRLAISPTTPAPLLLEDQETRGLRVLDSLREPSRVIAAGPKSERSPANTTRKRLWDILEHGVKMANETKLPIALEDTGTAAPRFVQVAAVQAAPEARKTAQHIGHATSENCEVPSAQYGMAKSNAMRRLAQGSASPPGQTRPQPPIRLDQEGRVLNMVNDFLTPPDPPSAHLSPRTTESSLIGRADQSMRRATCPPSRSPPPTHGAMAASAWYPYKSSLIGAGHDSDHASPYPTSVWAQHVDQRSHSPPEPPSNVQLLSISSKYSSHVTNTAPGRQANNSGPRMLFHKNYKDDTDLDDEFYPSPAIYHPTVGLQSSHSLLSSPFLPTGTATTPSIEQRLQATLRLHGIRAQPGSSFEWIPTSNSSNKRSPPVPRAAPVGLYAKDVLAVTATTSAFPSLHSPRAHSIYQDPWSKSSYLQALGSTLSSPPFASAWVQPASGLTLSNGVFAAPTHYAQSSNNGEALRQTHSHAQNKGVQAAKRGQGV